LPRSGVGVALRGKKTQPFVYKIHFKVGFKKISRTFLAQTVLPELFKLYFKIQKFSV